MSKINSSVFRLHISCRSVTWPLLILKIPIYGDDEKPSDEKTATFIRRSSILAFCHYTIILVILLCLGQYQPEYFQEQFNDVVLLPKNRKEFFYLPGFIIVLGFYSMVLSLHVADEVARLEVGTIRI